MDSAALRSLLALCCLVSALGAAEPQSYPVYDAVSAALAGQPHRLPGSAGYQAAVDAVSGSLAAAGVKTQRLRYATLVPATRTCRLLVDGTEISGLLAMAPNGAVPPTTWGRELEGPAVWLGDGTLAEMRGLPVAGAIAFVRLGTDKLPEIFAQGALAVVAVGDDATQWQTAKMFTEAPVSSPRAWLPKAQAEAAGLTVNPPQPRRAKLSLEVRWTEVEATTLWAFIPAAEGTPAGRAEQTMVLASELATSGAVPECSPGGRSIANIALLAELAARLGRERPQRNVLVVFLGSHYAAQDGARTLYWVVNAAKRKAGSIDMLAEQAEAIEATIANCNDRLGLLASDAVLTTSGDDAAWIRNQLRRILNARVNAFNYTVRTLNLQRKVLLDRKDAAAVAAMDLRISALKTSIDVQNNLRRQLHERKVSEAVHFADLRGQLLGEVSALRDAMTAERGHFASYRELEGVLRGQLVTAHLGVDFASASAPWMASPFGLECDTVNVLQPGYFSKHIDAYQQVWDQIAPQLPGAPGMRAPDRSTTYGYENLCTPARRQVACVVPLGLGIMGSQLVTLGDPLDRDEMPSGPTPDLRALVVPVGRWFASAAAADLPSKTGMANSSYLPSLVRKGDGTSWSGMRADLLAKGSEEVDGPAAGAVVFVGSQLHPSPSAAVACGRSASPMGLVNPAGNIFIPMVSQFFGSVRVNALWFGEGGAPEAYYDGAASAWAPASTIRLFSGSGNGIYTPFLPADYSLTGSFIRLMGSSDGVPKRSFGGVGIGGAVAVTSETRALKLHGNGLFILGPQASKAQGVGIAPDPSAIVSLDAVRHSAEETTVLNRRRLEVLRSKGLVNRTAERLHADCVDNLEAAHEERAAGETRRAAGHETFASVLAYRAHGPLRDEANDLVKAVVVLLVLSIPFAFAVERLVLGAVSIYRQIAGFLGIFLATFVLLYVTHPAFAMADSPLIIFLSFVIILLSSFVISVVMGKFKHELKAIQGLSTKSHSTGNANSTTFAAIIIGIAGMRNRPLKTFLTISTVTLLTFTILVFASFQSGQAVVESWLGRSRGVDRIEVHQPSFLPIPDHLVDAIEAVHADKFDIVRRSACFYNPLASTQEKNQAHVLLEPITGRALRLDALVSIDPRESARLPALAELVRTQVAPGGAPPVWLSETIAAQWKLQPGAEVRIRGHRFVFAGAFADDKLRALENIDDTKVLPPDFQATFAASGAQPTNNTSASQAIQALDISSLISVSPSLTAITLPAQVAALGGGTSAVVLYPKAGADLHRTAGEIAEIFNGPVYATAGDGARKFFFTREVTGVGYMDLLVPLLLGGLIIFSSLLGSIVDRQKEIFTYSALGLSPRDVGTLFFAESAVIAVVGGMGGYLVGQLAAKVLNLLAGKGLLAVPDLNFSSLSSLITILIVMVMVMLSTIYPALMASRSANPGVNRSWRMPKPEGDRLSFTFPFTVPESSFGGIVAFIREHFRNHGDAALDVFAAKDPTLFRVDATRIGIRAGIALSPFDLGVYQKFSMSTRPSDIPGIDEVVVDIERVNGAAGSWLRGNRNFVSDLREQFLLWRSLPPEVVAHYQSEAVRILEGGSEEVVHGEN